MGHKMNGIRGSFMVRVEYGRMPDGGMGLS